MSLPENLYVGTVSWSKPDWVGPFYPERSKPSQFLQAYTRNFRTVEIDSTFYRIPTRSTVAAWKEIAPPGFVFAAKVPRVITHVKRLKDCQSEFSAFLRTMEILGNRLGPLLLQLPYFRKSAFASRQDFEKLLLAFLDTRPTDFQLAVEIKNDEWLTREFLTVLQDNRISLARLAHPSVLASDILSEAPDLVPGQFCYVRFMGERKTIEAKTQTWDRIIEDKTEEMSLWVNELKKVIAKGIRTYVFFSNYYAGFGPASAKLFQELWEKA